MPVAHYCHGGKGKKHILHRQLEAGPQAKMFGFADRVTESTKIQYNHNTSEGSTSGRPEA